MIKNYQQRKERFRKNLKGVGGAALSGGATLGGVGYTAGLALSKESNAFKRTKVGGTLGLVGGALAAGTSQYLKNRKKNKIVTVKPQKPRIK